MQQFSKQITAAKRPALAAARATPSLSAVPCTQFSGQPTHKPQLSMVTEESKHRMKLPLYDLMPKTENNWVAPNSTISKCPAILRAL